MAEMVVTHEKGRRFVAKAREHKIIADLSPDRGGSDTGATPPELFIASLGTCIGMYVTFFADRHKLKHEGFRVHLSWEQAESPHRIGRISARVEMPSPVPMDLREPLQRTAEQCLVHNTIKHNPEITIEIA